MLQEIILVEALKLDNVKPGIYSLHCLALRLVGAEGSPIRCILIKWVYDSSKSFFFFYAGSSISVLFYHYLQWDALPHLYVPSADSLKRRNASWWLVTSMEPLILSKILCSDSTPYMLPSLPNTILQAPHRPI